jgi:hypothetical protein
MIEGGAGGVGFMGGDWLAGEGRSSICLLNLSFHTRKSNCVFSSIACCFAPKKIWKDMVMV